MDYHSAKERAKELRQDEPLIAELLSIAGVADTKNARIYLRLVLEAAPHSISAFAKRTKPRELNDELANIESLAHELQQRLEKVSSASAIYLWTDGELSTQLGIDGDGYTNPFDGIKALEDRILDLKLAAADASVERNGGSPKQSDKRNIRDSCAAFFERFSEYRVSNKENSRFLRFVSTVYARAGGDESGFRKI